MERGTLNTECGIVEEETDETIYWLELLTESSLVEKENVQYLLNEANQLLAIIVASIKTARGRKNE